MTRANAEQQKHTPWFAKAGAACSIVPLARFVGPNIFALKGGGYGCLFSLTGVDDEGKTDQELEALVRTVEGALRGLPEGSCLYQYTRVLSLLAESLEVIQQTASIILAALEPPVEDEAAQPPESEQEQTAELAEAA